MKIFLDTADVGEIHRASDAGLIDGITTNPSSELFPAMQNFRQNFVDLADSNDQ